MKQDREAFWYAIPGAWFGCAQPYAGNDCYAVVDAERILDAVQYFLRHKRSVRITETRVSTRESNAVHISYVWVADVRAAQVDLVAEGSAS